LGVRYALEGSVQFIGTVRSKRGNVYKALKAAGLN
jgi:hypothetical protein